VDLPHQPSTLKIVIVRIFASDGLNQLNITASAIPFLCNHHSGGCANAVKRILGKVEGKCSSDIIPTKIV